MKIEIRIDEYFMERCGSFSLLGTFMKKCLEVYETVNGVDELDLIFIKSVDLKPPHSPGVKYWKIPSYSFPLFLNDIFKLQSEGIKINILYKYEDIGG